MKTSKKQIRKLIAEAVIKYANGNQAVNASGVFSKESLEKQFQKFYEEGKEYQASIIKNPDGMIVELTNECPVRTINTRSVFPAETVRLTAVLNFERLLWIAFSSNPI